MNRETGTVTIEVDGQTYTLIFDMDAMVTLEGVFSTPDRVVTTPEIMDHMVRGSITHVRAFLWAALRAHHPTLTQSDVSGIVRAAGGLDAFGAQMKALTASARPDPADLVALGVPDRARPTIAKRANAAARRRSPPAPGIGDRSISKPAATG